eukprot:622201-Rhodomonas_salina.2
MLSFSQYMVWNADSRPFALSQQYHILNAHQQDEVYACVDASSSHASISCQRQGTWTACARNHQVGEAERGGREGLGGSGKSQPRGILALCDHRIRVLGADPPPAAQRSWF